MNLKKQSVKIIIFDITGREIFAEERSCESENEIKTNNALLNGSYFVKVKFEDGSYDVHRLIIAR